MPDAVTFVFLGRFDPTSFADFIAHRARRLALTMRLGSRSQARIEVDVAGQADLVDAFEMACSLGPIDCLVLDVQRETLRHGAEGGGASSIDLA